MYFAAGLILLVVGINLAIAAYTGSSGVGHDYSELQTCSSNGQVLKMSGGAWTCGSDDNSGGADTNAGTICGSGEYLDGSGSCVEVLSGDLGCLLMYDVTLPERDDYGTAALRDAYLASIGADGHSNDYIAVFETIDVPDECIDDVCTYIYRTTKSTTSGWSAESWQFILFGDGVWARESSSALSKVNGDTNEWSMISITASSDHAHRIWDDQVSGTYTQKNKKQLTVQQIWRGSHITSAKFYICK